MTQPTVYIVMGGNAAVEPSALAREEGSPGEILETVVWKDGKPDWSEAGICDHRGEGGDLGIYQLSMALDFAEDNAKGIGFEIVRVPKDRERERVSEEMTNEALAATVKSGLALDDREGHFALEILMGRVGND